MATERFRITLVTKETKDRKTGETITKWVARYYDRESEKENKRIKTLIMDSPVTKVRGKGESKARLEAESKLKDLIDSGILSKSLGNDPLVKDYLLDYWKYIPKKNDLRELRKETRSVTFIKNELGVIKKHWVPALGTLRMHKLSVEVIDAIMKKWNEEGMPNNTINRRLCPLKTAIAKWAKKNRIPNPLEYLEKATKEPVKPRGTLSLKELHKIINLEDESPRLKTIVLLGALCGMRKGEIRGLLLEDVDMEKKIIHIRHNYVADEEGIKDPKFQSFRTVPIPAEVMKMLELLESIPHKESKFVLWNDRSPEKPVSQTLFNYGFPDLLERIGISKAEKKKRNLVFHGLRHSFISNCRANGIPDYIVQQMAGHSSMEMTEHYSHGDEKVIDFGKYRAQMDGVIAKAGGEK